MKHSQFTLTAMIVILVAGCAAGHEPSAASISARSSRASATRSAPPPTPSAITNGPVLPSTDDTVYQGFDAYTAGELEDDQLEVCNRFVPLPVSGSFDELDEVKAESPLISDYGSVTFTAGRDRSGTPVSDLTFTYLKFINASSARAGWTRIVNATKACTHLHDEFGDETVNAQPVPGLESLTPAGEAVSFTQQLADNSEPFDSSVGVQLTGRYLLIVAGTAPTVSAAEKLSVRGWRWFASRLPSPPVS